MPKRKNIEFFVAKTPITDFVTKFGGHPNWIEKPEWPLSKVTSEPMRFIGQIALESGLFGSIAGRMAYLFMTDDTRVNNTSEPNGGENALIIQPGINEVRTEPLRKGPTLYRMVEKFSGAINVPDALEFSVHLTPDEDPEWLSESAEFKLPQAEFEARNKSLCGNKIGGVPGFLQGDEFPDEGVWKLVLQLDSGSVPFFVNFGDAGIGYAFIAEDGRRGKFLWQCC